MISFFPFGLQSFWRKYAADRDLPATWKPHILGRQEKYNKMKYLKPTSKGDLLGVPFLANKGGRLATDRKY